MIMWVMDRQPYDQIKTSENTTRDSRHSICERVPYKFKQMYTYSTTGIYGSWLSIFALTKLRANCVIPKFCYKNNKEVLVKALVTELVNTKSFGYRTGRVNT